MITLSFSLLVQGSIIAFHYLVGAIQLPTFITEQVNESLAKESLELSFDGANLDLGGHLVFKNLSLLDQKTNIPLFEADYVYLKISRTSLLLGKVVPLSAHLYQGQVFELPDLFYTDDKMALLNNVFLALKQTDSGWRLGGLSADWKKIELYLSGTVEKSFIKELLSEEKKRTDPPSWRAQLIALQNKIKELTAQLTISPLSTFRASFSTEVNKISLEDIHLAIPQFAYQDQISIENLSFSGKGSWSPGEPRIFLENAAIHKFSYNEYKGNNLSIEGAFANNLWLGQLLTHSLQLPQRSIDLLSTYFSYDPNQQILNLESRVEIESKTASFDAKYSFESQKTTVQIESETHPLQWYKLLPANKIPPAIDQEVKKLADQGQWFYRVNAELTGDNMDQVSAFIHAQNGKYGSVEAQSARAKIIWKDKLLSIEEIKAKANDNQVAAEMDLDFKQLDGFLDIQGSIHPSLIDEFMPKWWKMIFSHFTSLPLGVSGDFHVQFPLEKASRYLVFGSASGRDTIFRNMPTRKGSCNVYVIPRFVDLFNIKFERDEGISTGDVQWVYEKGIPNPFATHFSAESNFLPNAWHELITKDINEILKKINSNKAPNVLIDGIWYGSHTSKKDDTKIKIKATTPNALSFDLINCTSLSLDLAIDRKQATLTNIDAQLYNGSFNGDFGFLFQEQDNFSIVGTLSDVDYPSFKKIIRPEEKDTIEGKLSATIDAEGTFQDWASFVGSLFIKLDQANITQLPLLGFLSQLSTIGKVNINKATANFSINRNLMQTNNLLLSGPTTKITGKGKYQISEGIVDFNLQVLPLKQIPVFMPLSYVLKVDLYNTLSDPKWRFSRNPFNILRPEPNARNKEK